MGIDWSDCPPELLEMIASKLTVYIDYVRFPAVCVKWHSSLSPTPHHLLTQFPWLMFSSSEHNITHHLFLDLSTNKFHRFNLSECEQSRRCCGSSQGWLVLVEEDSPIISLLNPLTQIQIHLPPVTTFPNVLDFNSFKLGEEYLVQASTNGDMYRRDMKNMRDFFIKKVVLSSSTSYSVENDYIALAILNETGELAFCKKGVEEWSIIEDAQSYSGDVIYYNGAFYAVNEEGSIAVCDLNGVSPMVTLITPPPLIWGHELVYLVDSFGELLLVTRHLVRAHGRGSRGVNKLYETVDFGVFKFDSSKPQWVQMETLGDHMLFLGGISSVCLSAYDYSGCQGNCIYFTYEYTDGVEGYQDLGVYHLDVRRIVPLPYDDGVLPYFLPQPIWVTPNP